MGSGPAPFSEIGKKVKDLLTKDYNFDQKFTLMMSHVGGLGLTTTGVKKDQLFIGDISTLYKSTNTTVHVKVDTDSNVSTTVMVNEIFPSMKTALSFKIPDHKSGKLDVQYLHYHATINSSIELTPAPLLELAASIGSKELSLGGEVGFNTASASFTKCNAGIDLNKQDFSASLILCFRHAMATYNSLHLPRLLDLNHSSAASTICRGLKIMLLQSSGGDKGETLKASYIHMVDPINGTAVAAEMTHRFTTYENSFTIGGSQVLDPLTLVKARLSHNGKVAMLCQREWRPKSLVTLSAEFDPKAVNGPPGLDSH